MMDFYPTLWTIYGEDQNDYKGSTTKQVTFPVRIWRHYNDNSPKANIAFDGRHCTIGTIYMGF